MSKVLGYIRLLLFFVLILLFLGRYMLGSIFSGRDLKRGLRLRQKFAKVIAKVIGIEMEVVGQPIEEPAIYISNHRSYYDPGGVSLDLVYGVIVAKAEIRDWPLIGYATDLIGIVFVDRDDPDSRRATRVTMAKALEDGLSVLIYPEGTTGDRPTSLDFLPGTFATAVKMNAPIVPIAIEFKHPEDAWISAYESFYSHYVKCFSKWKTPVKLRYGTPIFYEDVLTFKQKAQDWVDKNLLEMQAEFGGVDWQSTVDERIKETGR